MCIPFLPKFLSFSNQHYFLQKNQQESSLNLSFILNVNQPIFSIFANKPSAMCAKEKILKAKSAKNFKESNMKGPCCPLSNRLPDFVNSTTLVFPFSPKIWRKTSASVPVPISSSAVVTDTRYKTEKNKNSL